MDETITLGEQYRDKVSGFEGMATGDFHFLGGWHRVELTGKSIDGKAPETLVVEAGQLETV